MSEPKTMSFLLSPVLWVLAQTVVQTEVQTKHRLSPQQLSAPPNTQTHLPNCLKRKTAAVFNNATLNHKKKGPQRQIDDP